MSAFPGNFFSIFISRIGLFCLVISVCIVFAAFFLADNPPYVLIEADSQIVRYRVQRSGLASVPLRNAQYKNLPQSCLNIVRKGDADILSALLEPAHDSIVTYETRDDALEIKVQGVGASSGGRLSFADDSYCELSSDSSIFRIQRENIQLRPLPIAGPADIGEEFKSPNFLDLKKGDNRGFLSGGMVHVVGRSISPFAKDKLYPLGNSKFTIPPGGRISSGDNLNPGMPPSGAPSMYGTAEWEDKGLKITVSTVTDNLQIYRPGRISEVEELGLGLLNQILSDPGIVLFFMFLGCFSFLIQILNGLKNLAAKSVQQTEKQLPRKYTKKQRIIRHFYNAHRTSNNMRHT